MFLFFGELETNFVEGWSRGWKVLFQKRSGIPKVPRDFFCDVQVPEPCMMMAWDAIDVLSSVFF